MRRIAIAAALAATPFVAFDAEAKTIVTGGDVTVEVTLPLLDYDLWGTAAAGSPPAHVNEAGNPVVQTPIMASRGSDYSRGSQVVDGGYQLYMNGGVYLYPLKTSGDPTSEVESFADVFVFGEIPEGVTVDSSIRWRNYVRRSDGAHVDYSTGEVVELTAEQIALLTESQIRTCCRHSLTGLSLNTVDGTVDGRIDGVRERDINFDGVIDENDEFHFFDLVATGEEGVFDLALTDVMAQYINFGFTPLAFGGDPAFSEWARLVNGGGGLGLAGGDIIGRLTYSVNTAVVPVPAALPLLASGLGLIGFLRTRRSRQA
ncbi:MAG: VPLPA-CTERM sorting domain-containing protein [Pikeienuella sp.]